MKCIFDSCQNKSVTKFGHCNGHRKQFAKSKKLTPLKQKPQSMICIFPECGKKRDCKEGYCGSHKRQLKKNESLSKIKSKTKSVCSFLNCGRRHKKQGLCDVHDRQKKKGIPLHAVKPNRKIGTGCISTHGYKVHSKRINGKKVYLYEHRSIMENFLGRSLLPHENVHHINGDKLDNRIENLELWSKNQPNGQRIIDKIKWAQEILEQYKNVIHLLNDNQSSLK